jgi:hypothetical protein
MNFIDYKPKINLTFKDSILELMAKAKTNYVKENYKDPNFILIPRIYKEELKKYNTYGLPNSFLGMKIYTTATDKIICGI